MDYVQRIKALVPRRIHPYLGVVRRGVKSVSFRTGAQKKRLLRDKTLAPEERQLLQRVESRISTDDGMYTGDGAQYFKVGLSAIRCIEGAIEAARLSPVNRTLDLPCGHGRVLRFLAQRFPEAKITASDLDRAGVDFCARVFGAEPVYSELNPDDFSLAQKFDLIWCGSLVTHLDAAGITALLRLFVRHLASDGLLIFTTHGERVVRRMLNREFEYMIPQQEIEPLVSEFRKKGFGFVNYPEASGYGISLTSPEWIRAELEKLAMGEAYFREHGWDDHQDVFGFIKTDKA
jgi:SAM-dependent methyltransferase